MPYVWSARTLRTGLRINFSLRGAGHWVATPEQPRRPIVVITAKSDNLRLSHSGRESSEKTRGEQGGFPCTPLNARDNSLTHQ